MLVPYDNRFSISDNPWSVSLSHRVATSGGMDYPPFLENFKAAVSRGLQGLFGLGDSPMVFDPSKVIQNPDPSSTFSLLHPLDVDYTRPLGVTFAGGVLPVDPTKVNVPTLQTTINAAQTTLTNPKSSRESVTSAVQSVLNLVNTAPVTAAQAQNITDTQDIATNVQNIYNSLQPTNINIPVGYGANAPFWSQADAQRYAQEIAANPDVIATLQAQAQSQLSTDSLTSQASGTGTDLVSSIQNFVTNNPMTALAIVVGVGYLMMTHKKGRSKKGQDEE